MFCEHTGKMRYDTREAARGVLFGSRGVVKRGRQSRKNLKRLNVYHCIKCNGYHVGHSGGRTES